MIKVLLDTDVIIECLRNNTEVIDKLRELFNQESLVYYSPITKTEIYCGIRKGEENAVQYFFDQLDCLPVTDEIGLKAGLFQNTYPKSHNLELADAIIAATTIIHGLYLYTFNHRHYKIIKEVRFYNDYNQTPKNL
jgi:hypothetical protein